MHVLVEERKQLRIEIRRSLSLHTSDSFQLPENGTGHQLGPDLVILRGHGFNSSPAPPPGSRLSIGFVAVPIPVAIAIGSSLPVSLSPPLRFPRAPLSVSPVLRR